MERFAWMTPERLRAMEQDEPALLASLMAWDEIQRARGE